MQSLQGPRVQQAAGYLAESCAAAICVLLLCSTAVRATRVRSPSSLTVVTACAATTLPTAIFLRALLVSIFGLSPVVRGLLHPLVVSDGLERVLLLLLLLLYVQRAGRSSGPLTALTVGVAAAVLAAAAVLQTHISANPITSACAQSTVPSLQLVVFQSVEAVACVYAVECLFAATVMRLCAKIAAGMLRRDGSSSGGGGAYEKSAASTDVVMRVWKRWHNRWATVGVHSEPPIARPPPPAAAREDGEEEEEEEEATVVLVEVKHSKEAERRREQKATEGTRLHSGVAVSAPVPQSSSSNSKRSAAGGRHRGCRRWLASSWGITCLSCIPGVAWCAQFVVAASAPSPAASVIIVQCLRILVLLVLPTAVAVWTATAAAGADAAQQQGGQANSSTCPVAVVTHAAEGCDGDSSTEALLDSNNSSVGASSGVPPAAVTGTGTTAKTEASAKHTAPAPSTIAILGADAADAKALHGSPDLQLQLDLRVTATPSLLGSVHCWIAASCDVLGGKLRTDIDSSLPPVVLADGALLERALTAASTYCLMFPNVDPNPEAEAEAEADEDRTIHMAVHCTQQEQSAPAASIAAVALPVACALHPDARVQLVQHEQHDSAPGTSSSTSANGSGSGHLHDTLRNLLCGLETVQENPASDGDGSPSTPTVPTAASAATAVHTVTGSGSLTPPQSPTRATVVAVAAATAMHGTGSLQDAAEVVASCTASPSSVATSVERRLSGSAPAAPHPLRDIVPQLHLDSKRALLTPRSLDDAGTVSYTESLLSIGSGPNLSLDTLPELHYHMEAGGATYGNGYGDKDKDKERENSPGSEPYNGPNSADTTPTPPAMATDTPCSPASSGSGGPCVCSSLEALLPCSPHPSARYKLHLPPHDATDLAEVVYLHASISMTTGCDLDRPAVLQRLLDRELLDAVLAEPAAELAACNQLLQACGGSVTASVNTSCIVDERHHHHRERFQVSAVVQLSLPVRVVKAPHAHHPSQQHQSQLPYDTVSTYTSSSSNDHKAVGPPPLRTGGTGPSPLPRSRSAYAILGTAEPAATSSVGAAGSLTAAFGEVLELRRCARSATAASPLSIAAAARSAAAGLMARPPSASGHGGGFGFGFGSSSASASAGSPHQYRSPRSTPTYRTHPLRLRSYSGGSTSSDALEVLEVITLTQPVSTVDDHDHTGEGEGEEEGDGRLHTDGGKRGVVVTDSDAVSGGPSSSPLPLHFVTGTGSGTAGRGTATSAGIDYMELFNQHDCRVETLATYTYSLSDLTPTNNQGIAVGSGRGSSASGTRSRAATAPPSPAAAAAAVHHQWQLSGSSDTVDVPMPGSVGTITPKAAAAPASRYRAAQQQAQAQAQAAAQQWVSGFETSPQRLRGNSTRTSPQRLRGGSTSQHTSRVVRASNTTTTSSSNSGSSGSNSASGAVATAPTAESGSTHHTATSMWPLSSASSWFSKPLFELPLPLPLPRPLLSLSLGARDPRPTNNSSSTATSTTTTAAASVVAVGADSQQAVPAPASSLPQPVVQPAVAAAVAAAADPQVLVRQRALAGTAAATSLLPPSTHAAGAAHGTVTVPTVPYTDSTTAIPPSAAARERCERSRSGSRSGSTTPTAAAAATTTTTRRHSGGVGSLTTFVSASTTSLAALSGAIATDCGTATAVAALHETLGGAFLATLPLDGSLPKLVIPVAKKHTLSLPPAARPPPLALAQPQPL